MKLWLLLKRRCTQKDGERVVAYVRVWGRGCGATGCCRSGRASLDVWLRRAVAPAPTVRQARVGCANKRAVVCSARALTAGVELCGAALPDLELCSADA